MNRIINILIKNDIIKESDRDIYEYGLFVLIFNMFIIISIIIIGILIGKYELSLFFLTFYLPIRILLGGYHCSTPTRCYCSSMCIYLFICYLYLTLYKIIVHFYPVSVLFIFVCFGYKYFSKEFKSKNIVYILLLFIIYFTFLGFISNKLKIYIEISFILNSILFLLERIKRGIYNKLRNV